MCMKYLPRNMIFGSPISAIPTESFLFCPPDNFFAATSVFSCKSTSVMMSITAFSMVVSFIPWKMAKVFLEAFIYPPLIWTLKYLFKIVYEGVAGQSVDSILLYNGLNSAWHFWLSTRFSWCLRMISLEIILGYIRGQFLVDFFMLKWDQNMKKFFYCSTLELFSCPWNWKIHYLNRCVNHLQTWPEWEQKSSWL